MNEIKNRLLELYTDMVEKYKKSEQSVIGEMSCSIQEDMDTLDKECMEYMQEFSSLLDSFE